MNLSKILAAVTKSQQESSDIHLNPEKYNINSEVIQKSGKDYTNAVDIAVENFLKARLKREFPEIGFLGEETQVEQGGRYFWIIDPTDGTAVYSTGGEYYSNSIALADRQDKKVIFGSVYQPTRKRQFVRLENEVYISEEIITKQGKKLKIERKLQPSKSKGLPELMGCAILPSKYREKNLKLYEKLAHLFDKIEFPKLERNYGMINAIPASGSSALFCCDIASGNRHFALLYFQKAWDLAAGSLFARDSGCIVEPEDLEQTIATSAKESLIDVKVFANPYVRDIVMSRLNR